MNDFPDAVLAYAVVCCLRRGADDDSRTSPVCASRKRIASPHSRSELRKLARRRPRRDHDWLRIEPAPHPRGRDRHLRRPPHGHVLRARGPPGARGGDPRDPGCVSKTWPRLLRRLRRSSDAPPRRSSATPLEASTSRSERSKPVPSSPLSVRHGDRQLHEGSRSALTRCKRENPSCQRSKRPFFRRERDVDRTPGTASENPLARTPRDAYADPTPVARTPRREAARRLPRQTRRIDMNAYLRSSSARSFGFRREPRRPVPRIRSTSSARHDTLFDQTFRGVFPPVNLEEGDVGLRPDRRSSPASTPEQTSTCRSRAPRSPSRVNARVEYAAGDGTSRSTGASDQTGQLPARFRAAGRDRRRRGARAVHKHGVLTPGRCPNRPRSSPRQIAIETRLLEAPDRTRRIPTHDANPGGNGHDGFEAREIEAREKACVATEDTRPGLVFRPDIDILEHRRRLRRCSRTCPARPGRTSVDVRLDKGVLTLDATSTVDGDRGRPDALPLRRVPERRLPPRVPDLRGHRRCERITARMRDGVLELRLPKSRREADRAGSRSRPPDGNSVHVSTHPRAR